MTRHIYVTEIGLSDNGQPVETWQACGGPYVIVLYAFQSRDAAETAIHMTTSHLVREVVTWKEATRRYGAYATTSARAKGATVAHTYEKPAYRTS